MGVGSRDDFESRRRYHRYHRLIDRSPRVWFHAFQEDSMTPFERPTRRVAFRAGIVAFATMIVLALSSTSARRVDNDTAQTSTATDVQAAALSANEVRGASPYIE